MTITDEMTFFLILDDGWLMTPGLEEPFYSLEHYYY